MKRLLKEIAGFSGGYRRISRLLFGVTGTHAAIEVARALLGAPYLRSSTAHPQHNHPQNIFGSPVSRYNLEM